MIDYQKFKDRNGIQISEGDNINFCYDNYIHNGVVNLIDKNYIHIEYLHYRTTYTRIMHRNCKNRVIIIKGEFKNDKII